MSTITLALSLKRSLAPVTTNRTFHAKTYKNCFLGTDAVLALKNLFPHPEGLALERGNELIQSGLCGHVVAEHMFVDTGKMLYYRFDDARIIEALEAENEANDFFNNGLRADKRETEVFSERIQAQNDTLSRSLMLSALALLSLLPSSMTYLQLLLSSTALLTALYTLFTSKHIPTSVPDTIASRTSSAFTVYQPQRSAIPPPAEWPHRPLCLVDNVDGPPLPIGREIAIDSEMFSGKLLLRVAGAPCDDPADSAKYFLGRRRRFQVIIQGRFKERVPVSDVLTGQVFERGVKLRPKWLIRAAEALISKLAPSTSFELNRKVNARALSILAATSQAVRVDRRGAEVDIRDFNVKENTTLMGGVFGESNLSAKRRKQILSKSKVAEAFTFDTENVYTFDFYQSLLDAHKYELNLGVSRANLCNFLEGQPIQLLAVGRDGREFWRYQLWHEGLLKSMGWTS